MKNIPLIAQAIIYRNNCDKIEYLLIKRREKDGGFWQAITGHIRDGEKLVDGLVREIKEEIGVVDAMRISNCVETIQWTNKNNFVMTENVYVVNFSNEIIIKLSEEHTDYKWCDFKEAYERLFHINNKNTFELVNKLILNGKLIMPYLLYLEGMDLSGKTTVATRFAKTSNLNWNVNQGKLSQTNLIYDLGYELGKNGMYDSEILGYVYLAALLSDIRNFKLNKNTIQDSFLLLKSLNYYIINGNDKMAQNFHNLILKHPKCDKSFYLTADIVSRRQRLELRIKYNPNEKLSANDLLIINNPNKFEQMDKSLMELSIKYFDSQIIDTSQTDVDEVVEILRNACPFEKEK
ncbi:MAG: NUDIX domain-containing protein [Oscillospiraceae bacterium]|jgi:dATP pyrophosphohydrolase|nr:NUDIX domain-containing protein [Oscillospiraceae bacterium]